MQAIERPPLGIERLFNKNNPIINMIYSIILLFL
jgi:hypothetical protein